MSNLIIFIDSLPYQYVKDHGLFSYLDNKNTMSPGMGYSVNLYWEIFAGKTPDEVGFFNDWQLGSEHSPLKSLEWSLPFLKMCTLNYYIDRIVHRLLAYKLGYLGNVPFRYLPFFYRAGKNVYDRSVDINNLFKRNRHIELILPQTHQLGKKDEEVYQKAIHSIEKGSTDLYLAMYDLDGIGHLHGVGSDIYHSQILRVEHWISHLFQNLKQKHPNAKLIVFSDHGMANVEKGVSLNLEQKFGVGGMNSYLYFLDSSICRIWYFDRTLQDKMEDYLCSLHVGTILSRNERERYGCRSNRWGDTLFLLDEKYSFSPDFFGKKLPKAMHGYHPDILSQQAVLMTDRDHEVLKEIRRTIDMPKLWKRYCNYE
jgi:hypothetical protein